jgi:beta-1,4-mannooligosaccharide/beta-1,4-mannosyl-N-acetylglucosamine phosphorylase
MRKPVPEILTSSPLIRRHPANPVLSHEHVPYPATLVFNAGVTQYQGQYVMVFRNDYGEWGNPWFHGTNLGLAFSQDGITWQVEPEPCWDFQRVVEAAAPFYTGKQAKDEIIRAYDPRLTVINGQVYMCFAFDTKHGLRGGIARTADFYSFQILSLSAPDNRNMVLFPERIDDRYVRLERPMPIYSRGPVDRFDLWLANSPDLAHWGSPQCVLAVEDVPFANDKVGPGAPPVRTERGWLTTFHAVDIDPERGKNGWEDRWQKRYTIGIMLLDLEDPARVIGLSQQPLLAPEADYETTGGFRCDVLFPGGMILEESGEVKIYYGAADTVECVATADVADLLSLCGM